MSSDTGAKEVLNLIMVNKIFFDYIVMITNICRPVAVGQKGKPTHKNNLCTHWAIVLFLVE